MASHFHSCTCLKVFLQIYPEKPLLHMVLGGKKMPWKINNHHKIKSVKKSLIVKQCLTLYYRKLKQLWVSSSITYKQKLHIKLYIFYTVFDSLVIWLIYYFVYKYSGIDIQVKNFSNNQCYNTSSKLINTKGVDKSSKFKINKSIIRLVITCAIET